MSWSQIPPEADCSVRKKYVELGFCFETRLHLANFVENNFIDANLDDASALNFASKLLSELDIYVQQMPDSPSMLTSKRILQSTCETLKVCMYFYILKYLHYVSKYIYELFEYIHAISFFKKL